MSEVPFNLEELYGKEPSEPRDMSCVGHARIILEELQKLGIPAQILSLYDWWNNDEDDLRSSHSYVVPFGFGDEQLPLNRSGYDELEDGSLPTCGYLREHAEDITEEALSAEWSEL